VTATKMHVDDLAGAVLHRLQQPPTTVCSMDLQVLARERGLMTKTEKKTKNSRSSEQVSCLKPCALDYRRKKRQSDEYRDTHPVYRRVKRQLDEYRDTHPVYRPLSRRARHQFDEYHDAHPMMVTTHHLVPISVLATTVSVRVVLIRSPYSFWYEGRPRHGRCEIQKER
jgi:hypothetical protein